MIYAAFIGGGAVLAAIVTLAIIAIRATNAKGDARAEAAVARADAVKASAAQLEAEKKATGLEVELAAEKKRTGELEESTRAAETVAKELYAELRRRGVPGAADRLDALFERMRADQGGQDPGPDAGAREGDGVQGGDTRSADATETQPLPKG